MGVWREWRERREWKRREKAAQILGRLWLGDVRDQGDFYTLMVFAGDESPLVYFNLTKHFPIEDLLSQESHSKSMTNRAQRSER